MKNSLLKLFFKIEELQIINLFCYDEFLNETNIIQVKSYPPIGGCVFFEDTQKYFEIQQIIIRSPNGTNCQANGVFKDFCSKNKNIKYHK